MAPSWASIAAIAASTSSRGCTSPRRTSSASPVASVSSCSIVNLPSPAGRPGAMFYSPPPMRTFRLEAGP